MKLKKNSISSKDNYVRKEEEISKAIGNNRSPFYERSVTVKNERPTVKLKFNFKIRLKTLFH